MTRMLDGHLVRDPHDLRAEAQVQQQAAQQEEAEARRRASMARGKYESQTVREAVLQASAELA